MIVIFCFYFVPKHNNYISSQVHYYEQMVTSDVTRLKIITEQINRMKEIGEDTEKLEKSRDFWQAEDMFSRLVKEYADRQGVTEQLKAENQLEWVGKMNNIRSRAVEIIDVELICV